MREWIIHRIASRRQPDAVIGGMDDPYMLRWYIIPRNRFLNIYLHCFLRSDDDEALHDHPWPNLSVLLRGRYWEHTIRAGGVHYKKLRMAGTWAGIKFRLPWSAHRVEVNSADPPWSLFITGPTLRSWGFHCPKGWKHWREFTTPSNGSSSGTRRKEGCG